MDTGNHVCCLKFATKQHGFLTTTAIIYNGYLFFNKLQQIQDLSWSCWELTLYKKFRIELSALSSGGGTHHTHTLRGEWPSGLYSLRQVTEFELGRVRSNSGWVTSEA